MKFKVNFYSRFSNWDKTIIVRNVSNEKEALMCAAKKLKFDGWHTEDAHLGYGDVYHLTDNGMSFHEGSRAKKFFVEKVR